MGTIKESWIEDARADAWRKAQALDEARRVWDVTNIEARDLGRLDNARLLYQAAESKLRRLEQVWREQKEREYAADLKKRARVPPDLQALVEAHGGWDRIPQSAWNQFDYDMARWKTRLRLGDDFQEEQTALRRADEENHYRLAG
jgi:hypothetical protein